MNEKNLDNQIVWSTKREIVTLSAPRNRASGHVRIISGQWRGRKLPVIDAQGLRPTTDRTKETLFNWLMHDIANSRCLDAFAGAGSLGFEALSRGASDVTFIEKDKKTAQVLTQNVNMLQANATVVCADTLSFLAQLTQAFDIVFVDPPYQLGLVEPCLKALIKGQWLNENALIYVEQEASAADIVLPSMHLIKQKSTAQFRYALYRFSQN